jgi:hypothetical protein
MVGNASIRTGRMVALAAALAVLCALLAIWNTSSAHAERYCWGYNLPSQGSTCHLDHERWASEVRGMGTHSVCVWHAPYGPIRCSTGANVWVSNNYGANYWGVPYIQNNAPGSTVGYGEAF